jgi:hypothetical protein
MYTLATPQVVTNGTRVALEKRRLLEDEKVFTCVVTMRTGPVGTPPDTEISARPLEITGPQTTPEGTVPGTASVVGRNTLASGDKLTNLLKHFPSISVDDTQWAALVTAYKASLGSLESHLRTANYLHSTLAGT